MIIIVKRIHKTIGGLLALILVCLTLFYCRCAPYLLPYSPPIPTDTAAWKELELYQRTELSQIPERILTHQRTEVLIQSTLNQYCIGDYIAYWPDYDRAYRAIQNKCNGLGELELRKDAAKELINAYAKARVAEMGKSSFASRKRLRNLEFIIAQDAFLSKMSESEFAELSSVSQEKYKQKVQMGWDRSGCLMFYSVLRCSHYADEIVPPDFSDLPE